MIWLRSPDLANVFVGREAVECLESARIVVGRHEVREVRAQLVVAVVVIPFHRSILDRSVHPLDLAVGPWMVRFGQSVFNLIGLADHVETHGPRIRYVTIAGLFGELDAIIGQDRMNAIRDDFEKHFEELSSGLAICLVYELGDSKLAGPVNAHEHIQLALGGLNLRDVDVKESDWVALEALPLRFVPLDVGQARDAMPLKAPM